MPDGEQWDESIEPLPEPPVRLCCGQRHRGPLCLDDKVMCCLCFNRFPVDELNLTEDGDWEDVCQGCADKERERMSDHD